MAELEQKLQEGQPVSVYPEIAFGVDLARRIARAVMPVYGIKQNDVPINQISKDFNYALDQKAEDAVRISFEKAWRQGLVFGYVTEDQGMVMPPDGKAKWMFLIDPVDGSRPANIGGEQACVNIVIVRGDIPEPTLSDVEMGVTLALKERLMFVTKKGEGIFLVQPSLNKPPLKRDGRLYAFRHRQNVTDSLSDSSMVYETYSMSAELTGIVIDPLLTQTSFKTEYPSGSYAALTLVRGQNELHVDLRRRLILDRPDLPVMLKPNSKALGPMDIAPQFLMLKELGMVVTDAYGNHLDNARLWKFNPDSTWSDEIQLSWVAAATPTLHQKAMIKIEEGFTNLATKYLRV